MNRTLFYIALMAPGEVNEKIAAFKNLMLQRYGAKVALKSPAHITLLPPFLLDPAQQPALEQSLDEFSATQQPFEIQTSNFSSFAPKTIYIDIADNSNLGTLKKSIDEFFKTRPQYRLRFEDRPFRPHMTIATRDLKKEDFREAWAGFREMKFEEGWRVDGVSLLRHNAQKNWDVVHTSQFRKQV